jgi:hypothetical protein
MHDFVKLNIDAVFYADDLRGSTGAIIRDNQGAFIAASCNRIGYVHDAFSADVQALNQGLLLAQ